MRTVTVTATAEGLDPDEAYRRIADLTAYPEVCDSVLSVTQQDLGAGRTRSTWEVEFRDGVVARVISDTYHD